MARSRSLSLAAYRVLSWRGAPQNGDGAPQRPDGELLWVHVSERERLAPLNDLCRRLLAQRAELSVLLTGPSDADLGEWGESCSPLVPLPQDNAGAVRGFLDHWRPEMGLWSGAGLLPNLISDAAGRDIPMVLLEVDTQELVPHKPRWLPDLPRQTLECFESILVTNDETARQIRRLGVMYAKVAISARLRVSSNPAPWPEDELIETNHALASRPVWLAAWVQDKEFISVLTAHRHALRLLHRMVLILHVADGAEADPLRKRLETMDLRCANWDAGDEIEDTTQVILTAYPEDLGLWYRVSPLTFVGSSLEPGPGGKDPLVAVALGSAVIHGPNVGEHADIYKRLADAGAARQVRTAEELGKGVVELLSPDQAASVALAGWQVVSEGAQLTDQLIDMVQDRLDRRRAEHAGT
ncbi:3-deoxy-D-manno-octulosonic acid transferase [Ruegeria sp. HKCCD8929]|uniref:3-deoxy-D-manno-octulosonic acid transferase n=1 Tax=Ruegeria sp. HKCCD8929 TaxID=2683006 RepID=UPI0035302323